MSPSTQIQQHGNTVKAVQSDKLEYGDDAATAAFIQAQKERQKSERERQERRWFLNIAYLAGHQYMQWDPYRKALFLPHQPKHRIRIVVNRLLPMVRRVVSTTLRQRPQWVVNPATDEVEDRITSLLLRDFLRDSWRKLSMDKKLQNLLMWRETCGDVFLRTYWDPFAAEKFAMSAEDVASRIPLNDEERNESRKSQKKRLKKEGLYGPDDSHNKTVFLGDVALEVVSPFNVYPDPDATNLEECTFLIDCRQRPSRYVRERYGFSKADLAASGSEGPSNRLQQLKSLSPVGVGSGSLESADTKSDLVDIDTIWVRPTVSEPNGWWASVSNNKVLRKGRNKPGFPSFPWTHAQSIHIPGKFWGTCGLEQAVPVQVAYNRARSQILEHVNTVSRPPWLVPKNSGITRESFTGEPGEIIQYTFPLKPELAAVRDLPGSSHQNAGQIITDIEDVTSQHEATRGVAPGRVESGVGVAQLQEQDDGILAPTNTSLAAVLAETGSQLGMLAAQNYTEQRLIRIFGQDQMQNVRHFKGEDLMGNSSGKAGVNYFDVTVEMGTNLPLSPNERRRYVNELAQYGIMNPQIKEQREKLLEILELNREPGSVSEGQQDIGNQRRENNMMMSTGQPVQIWEYDNDELHISTAREFQKSPEYWQVLQETGGDQSPIHQSFEMHIKMHSDRLLARAQAAQGGQQPSPGPQQPGETLPERQPF